MPAYPSTQPNFGVDTKGSLQTPIDDLVVDVWPNGRARGRSFFAGTLAPPVQTAPATSTVGGTLAAATYYYVVTALVSNGGETTKSNELSIVTTGATSKNTVNWNAVPGASGYRIYRGTAAGAEGVYYAVGLVTTFLDTGAASTAGSPPAVNTTGRYQWTLLHGVVSDADRVTLKAFYDANKLLLFDFVSPWDGATYHNVMFVAPIKYERLPGGYWAVTVQLRQQF